MNLTYDESGLPQLSSVTADSCNNKLGCTDTFNYPSPNIHTPSPYSSLSLNSMNIPHMNNTCKEVDSGTTIMACEFDGGVAIAADTRTSAGSFVVNRAARKISKLYDNIWVCRSGSAADTQALTQIVKTQLTQHIIDLNKYKYVDIYTAAILFQRLCFQYKNQLSAGLIICGYDNVHGPQIYSLPLGGSLIKQKVAIGGSGSVFITALVDELYTPKFNKQEAVNFVKKCVSRAISRDGSSGGMVRIITVTKDGTEEECVEGNKLPVNP